LFIVMIFHLDDLLLFPLSFGVMMLEKDAKTSHRPLLEMAGSKQSAFGSVFARFSDARMPTGFKAPCCVRCCQTKN
jgi:hypothetical protein